MASSSLRLMGERLRCAPLSGASLIIVSLGVWIAGAIYCSGYDALSTGLDNWPASLLWSAAAVLPWFALFEWSKYAPGRQFLHSWTRLGIALVGTAAMSLGLEYALNALAGDSQPSLALALMRRLPAIGASLVLILWAQSAHSPMREPDPELDALASSIDWLAAADNYVELRLGGRVIMRRMTMREAERALRPRGFIRIHRRFLVNRSRIVDVRTNGHKVVRLVSGIELPVGSRYAANLSR